MSEHVRKIVANACGSRSASVDIRYAVGTGPVVQLFRHASVLMRLPSSHCSVPSLTALPHIGAQSLSVFAFAPLGQQPSPFIGCVIGWNEQLAVQVLPLISRSRVQTFVSAHVVGHLPAPVVIAVSHVSPLSTTPLPQPAWQSLSFAVVAFGGQQPSLFAGCVIGVVVQCAWQLLPLISVSAVHATPSLQAAGHAPLPAVMPVSHSSPASSTPLPQFAAQSLSVF